MGGRDFIGLTIGAVGRLGCVDGEGGVTFDVVGAVVLDAGVSASVGGAACWVGGDVTGALGLQPRSIVTIRISAMKIAFFIDTTIIPLW